MGKISIIIPVYNVEPYIRRCLDSVINQTYKNLEILCINDGSTDLSGKICNEYAAKDARIRVIHKENGGSYSARNVGLNNATGRYIGFVDPDDWLELDMYETLYNLIQKFNVSFSAVSFFFDDDNGSVSAVKQEIVPKGALSQREMLKRTFTSPYYSGLLFNIWNKLYLAEFIRNNCLSFDESAMSGMDILFSCKLMLCDNCTCSYIAKPLYHYYQRSMSDSKVDNFEYNAKRLKIKKQCIDMITEKGYEDLTTWAKRDYGYHASIYMESAIKNNEDRQQTDFMKNEMKRYLDVYYKLNQEYPDRIERFNKLLEA